MLSNRFARLPSRALPNGLRVIEARSVRSRVLGLALLRELEDRTALLIPRCRSIHTFGMRFPLDVAFLDESGEVVSLVENVPRRRVLTCPRAHAVLEARAGLLTRYVEALTLSSPPPRAVPSETPAPTAPAPRSR